MEKVILRLFTPPGDNVTPPRPKRWIEAASEGEREGCVPCVLTGKERCCVK